MMKNYVVVIGISGKGAGRFITAFVADSGRTLQMIRKNPKWAKKTADLPGWLSGSLFRFYCHWQRTPKLYLYYRICQEKLLGMILNIHIPGCR